MDLLQNSKCKNVWNQVRENWTAVKMLLWKAQRVAMKMGMVLLDMFLLKMERMEIVKNNQKGLAPV